MVEFCAESISEFELMKDGKMFASAEELQLLRHTIDSTPYKRVRSLSVHSLNCLREDDL